MTRKKNVGQQIADELRQFARDIKYGKQFMVSRYNKKTGKFVRRKMTIDEVLANKEQL